MKKNNSPIWHPFTQHGLFPDSVPIARGEGAYLYKEDGSKIIDAISSWWVITHGHCHPKIVSAVQNQVAQLDQVIFAGFTHDPAEKVAEKLVNFTPEKLKHVFFTDSGSTAIEAALKMAIGYWEHTGRPRRKIMALEGGYHGDTFGAMSAGARSIYNRIYEPFLFEVEHMPFPAAGKEDKALSAFEQYVRRQGDSVAAFLFEPLLQGAGGMRVYSSDALAKMAKICQKYDILLIADEVLTGFGRTGTMFACEQAGISPDIMCMSKGLTAGCLPLGAAMASEDIYRAFYHKDRAKMFFHSSSFTGNPISCAAALASLEIWQQEPVIERVDSINKSYAKAKGHFSKRGNINNIRYLGGVFAMDIVDSGSGKSGYLSDIAPKLHNYFISHNILLRPLGNTVYIIPPYCIGQNDLGRIYECIDEGLNELGL